MIFASERKPLAREIDSLLGRERNGSINVLQNRFALYMR